MRTILFSRINNFKKFNKKFHKDIQFIDSNFDLVCQQYRNKNRNEKQNFSRKQRKIVYNENRKFHEFNKE